MKVAFCVALLVFIAFVTAIDDVENDVKRVTHEKLWLEVAWIYDYGYWKNYLDMNAGDAAETEQTLNQTMTQAFQTIQNAFTALQPPIYPVVTKYIIWKTAPTFTTEAKDEGDIHKYLSDMDKSDFSSLKLQVDVVVLVTGHSLNTDVAGGIAYGLTCSGPHDPRNEFFEKMNSKKTNGAIAILVCDGWDALGRVGSHEIGHLFGVSHDGSTHDPRAKDCPPVGFLLGHGSQGDRFSTCTQQSINSYISTQLVANNNNCFTNQPGKPAPAPSATTTKATPAGCVDLDPGSCAFLLEQDVLDCTDTTFKQDCRKSCKICT